MGAAKLIGENENVVRIMSIHKSKGLEFPIVFLCDTAKQFNFKDLSDDILLHQDLGLGPKYIDTDKKISYSTIAKEAIRIEAKKEAISEEMRVLYVALTRAREKLIITGVEKDSEKSKQKKQELLSTYDKIEPSLIQQNKSYLDWIELVYMHDKEMNELIDVYTYKLNDISKIINKEEKKEENLVEKWLPKDNIIDERINKLLNWEYENLFATTLETKTSVTKIKELQNNDKNTESKKEIVLPKPKFLNKTEKLTGAEKGTLIHLCLQKLDFSKQPEISDVENMIKGLVEKEIITQNEADQINVNLIYNFTKSNLYKEILKAKNIYKETPFYINIPASEIYNVESKEMILVQGIIDLYFENEQGNIVLVDYKTDYVQNEEELIEKYRVQLDLYKKALEQAIGKKVEKTYIYSIYLNKEISLEK